ncbi:hypothetical protein FQN57_005014 [Myotisia sp. PD_48]|nr:hypothetical protein FQN57_005014 [Myotisia sp. PD_48]
MEDSNPQATRKRPRLDSGNCPQDPVPPSMPPPSTPVTGGEEEPTIISPTTTSSTNPKPAPSLPQEEVTGNCVNPSEPSTPEKLSPTSPSIPILPPNKSPSKSPSERPSNRVTINMASLPANSQSTQDPDLHTSASQQQSIPKSDEQDMLTNGGGNDHNEPSTQESVVFINEINRAATAAGDPEEDSLLTTTVVHISDPPSPAQSVEIEVAELEDMDQNPESSNWRSLEDALRAPNATNEIIHLSPAYSFPSFSNSSLRDSVLEIRQAIERGNNHDGTFFFAVKAWFEQCCEQSNLVTFDSYQEHREFWDEVPGLVESVLKRSMEFLPDQGQGAMLCLEEFFAAYAELALRIIHLDTVQLRYSLNDEENSPDPISKTYWMAFSSMLQLRKIPFFTVMERTHGSELIDLVANLNDRLAGQSLNAVQILSAFIKTISAHLLKHPSLTLLFSSALSAIHNIVESLIERKRYLHESSQDAINLIRSAYEVFLSAEPTYQALIEKKSSSLTSEISDAILRNLGSSFRHMCHYDHSLATQIAEGLNVQVPEGVASTEFAHIVYLGWRFKILKKHIMSARMELRVQGIDAIQGDLVNYWSTYVHHNPPAVNHATTKFLVNFIRENKIVDYVVGVESHPQLISRGGNVVGFLVVTNTYSNEDTDVMWKTVVESQDPRTVSEVLGMLSQTFTMHQSCSGLLYICEKLTELPLHRFDSRMLEFCDLLLATIRNKQADSLRQDIGQFSYVDIVPVRLCIRLTRLAASIKEFSTEQQIALQEFANKFISEFTKLRIRESDEIDIFRECVQDISEMNEFAIGSINAINAMIVSQDIQSTRRLALDFDLARLVVMELAHAIDTLSPDGKIGDVGKSNPLSPRVQLLFHIVDKMPETITPELSTVLWEKAFMSKRLNEQSHTFIWNMLSQCVDHCGKRNPFLESFMNDYLLRISPEDISEPVLTFAKKALSYDIRFEHQHTPVEDEVIKFPGMDRIWRFILTAPNPTIGINAINFAIDIYLDHQLVRDSRRPVVEATHVSLVDRCVEQLSASAAQLTSFNNGVSGNNEDSPMAITPSDGEVQAEELRFSRSLLFLRQLLLGIRTRPQYTSNGTPPYLPIRPEQVKGDLVELQYQPFSSRGYSRIHQLKIGDLATGSELADKLTNLTGFSKFTTIATGKRIELRGSNANSTIRDMKLAGPLLLVRQEQDDMEVPFGSRRQSLTLVDSEVLKHFDDFYELLSLDERLSKQIFDFLVLFPPQPRVQDFVRSTDIGESELFPIKKPYKLLYAINSLGSCLRADSLDVKPDQEFISRSIKSIDSFLMRTELSSVSQDATLKLTIACSFIESLLTALRAKVIPDSPQPLFTNPSDLISLLVDLLSLDCNDPSLPLEDVNLHRLVSGAFATLVEASMHDSQVWNTLKNNTPIQDLLSKLLLSQPKQSIRKEIAEILFTICGTSPLQKQYWKNLSATDIRASGGLSTPIGVDMVSTLWTSLSSLLPRTVEYPRLSQEFFEVSLVIFQTVAKLSPNDMPYTEYLRTWGENLCNYRSKEFVGREQIDHVLLGFGYLIKMCLELADSDTITAGTRNFMETLFTTFMFPHLSLDSEERIPPKIPVMSTIVRQEFYNILALLCRNPDNCAYMLECLEDVIPYEHTYDVNWVYDRTKTIRAPEGYAGLRNLSNTCYLNSLFTQLFMNVDFRKFMLEVEVSEDDESQMLLSETKKVFSYLQDTWQKSVDTSGAVDCIRTHDNEPIDINIQMDVDEFYSLLFERWESQIKSAEEKKQFKSFYGGQLVQQIKSKECEHISERFESFSAIQCDIKGNATLEDSLRAYVEGEILQGDNKYSCTSCGKHVDAVKRACLKDLPDNLIFHLKRFDFDVMTMMRSKINDEFHFPLQIDMAPFTIEYQMNPDAPVKPDMFELVGVLVHSGTAESGHYYSYIKERPTAESNGSWVEFNDADVSRFDPAKISDQCFGGGMNDTLHGSGLHHMRFGKVWNAYMLFYQRVSSMEEQRSVYKDSLGDSPVTVPVQLELANHIAMENEMFIRTYCLLDPQHATFTFRLLEQSRQFNAADQPARISTIRKRAIGVMLDVLEQLMSRSKDIATVEPVLLDIGGAVQESDEAAFWMLQWTSKRSTIIRNLLVKSPSRIVRFGFLSCVIAALARLQERSVEITPDTPRQNRHRRDYLLMLESIIDGACNLWGTLYMYPRAWDDYFELLIGIANLGSYELELLLDRRMLGRCLEIVWLDRTDSKNLKLIYPNYARLMEKGKKFSHIKLMELLAVFLDSIDLTLPPVHDSQARRSADERLALSTSEAKYVITLGDKKELTILKKVIEQQVNHEAARRIFTTFLNATPYINGLMDGIVRVLEEGLAIEPAELCAPFLENTLLFCSLVTDQNRIRALVELAAKSVDSINDSGGRDHITFIQALSNLHNETICEKEKFFFYTLVIELAPFWAPTLLQYDDSIVRGTTLDHLQDILFTKDLDDMPESYRRFYLGVGRQLEQACVEKLRNTYLINASSAQPSVDSAVVEIIKYVISICVDKYFDADQIEGDAAILQRTSGKQASSHSLATLVCA